MKDLRTCARSVPDHVVLAYFDGNNWGKLINLSEGGMALEFARVPPLDAPISFTFELMSAQPTVASDSGAKKIETTGQVIWVSEFERIAGVRFVQLTDKARREMRGWLPAGKLAKTARKGKRDLKPALNTNMGQSASLSTRSIQDDCDALVAAFEVESPASQSSEFTKPAKISVEIEAHEGETEREATAAASAAGPTTSEEASNQTTSNSDLDRTTVMILSTCFVSFALLVALAARAPALHGAGPVKSVKNGANYAAPATHRASTAASSAAPFQVEVVEANNKRWVLTFPVAEPQQRRTNLVSPGNPNAAVSTSQLKDASPSEKGSVSTAQQEATLPPKSDSALTFKLARPNVPPSAATVAPPTDLQLTPPAHAGSGQVLATTARPSAPVAATPVIASPAKGLIQTARLVSSVTPKYPAFAKAQNVSGEVALDAVIDAKGNVTGAKVLYGSALLSEAAVEAVRSWKYEPARLNGTAVPTHLKVTVQFRRN